MEMEEGKQEAVAARYRDTFHHAPQMARICGAAQAVEISWSDTSRKPIQSTL
jgi:hypothetical protein